MYVPKNVDAGFSDLSDAVTEVAGAGSVPFGSAGIVAAVAVAAAAAAFFGVLEEARLVVGFFSAAAFFGAGEGDFFAFAGVLLFAAGDFPLFVPDLGGAGEGDFFAFAGVLLRVVIIFGDLLRPRASGSAFFGVFVVFFVLTII
jgi:hypothetical protein